MLNAQNSRIEEYQEEYQEAFQDQEETQNIEDTKISIPFSIPSPSVFSFAFEVELVDSLDIVFLGDDGYSLLSSENTDDFVHEQWDTSIESEFLFAQFYMESFWRLDLKDDNTSVFSGLHELSSRQRYPPLSCGRQLQARERYCHRGTRGTPI